MRGKIPVIALSAQVFTEQLDECRQAGMTGHLAKPFTEAALYATLAEHVAGAPPERRRDGVGAHDLTETDAPVIDLDVFRTNTRLLKPASVVSYLENIAASAGAVLAALRDWDGSDEISGDVVRAAHKLAGNVGLFGFARAADAARRFERAARTGTPETRLLAESLAAALHLSIREADERLAAARGPHLAHACPQDG
jgi:CheY-like chemotaxis protein